MSIAKVMEISSTSSQSFEHAVQEGVARASKTVRNIKSAWVKDQEVDVKDGKVVLYKVGMKITFIID